jgi:heat shock protein HslJ
MSEEILITRCSKWAFAISILILVGLLASCGEGATAVSAISDPELTGAEWMLATINDKSVANGTQATLVFGEANNVLGSTGCNLYAGAYAIREGSVLNFKPNLTTSWECEEPFFAQEKAMLLVLSSSSNYAIEGEELKIVNQDSDRRATYTKLEPLVLKETDWSLDAFNDGQGAFVNLIDGTQITASFENDGNLSGSGGCNEYNTTYTAGSNNISIGPILSTQMDCPEPEGVMDQESKYLTALEKAATYRNYSIALVIFDTEGQILASYISAEIASRR